VRSLPSQASALHASPPPSLHLVRVRPWTGPVTGEQVPAAPGTSHASHWPVHAVLQHTLSTQKPLVQSAGPVQGTPALGTHALSLQV